MNAGEMGFRGGYVVRGSFRRAGWLCGVGLGLWLAMPTARADWLMLWHAEAGGRLSERWEVKVESEVKFRQDMSEFYDSEIMPWVAYRFTPRFKLGAGWRQLYGRQNEEWPAPDPDTAARDHYWLVEQRPLLDFMTTVLPGPWTVDHRLRVEYRDVEYRNAYFRYRNRVRLRAPWSWTAREIKPWVAWEGYYEDDPGIPSGDRMNRHRFFVGLGADLREKLKAGAYYYVEEALKSGDWSTNHEIGFDVTAVF